MSDIYLIYRYKMLHSRRDRRLKFPTPQTDKLAREDYKGIRSIYDASHLGAYHNIHPGGG